MRRLIILALLLGSMQLVLPLGSPGQGSQTLLSFGFLILAAYSVGELAAGVRLPKIVGYLLAGVFFGPYVLGTVDAAAVARLTPVSQLAISLIAFLAGAELRWEEIRERGVGLLKMTGAELGVCFVALFGLLYALRAWIPFLAASPGTEVIAFALLFAAIAIVHSPAVTMALLSETGARGPVARTTLSIVLISDVVVVLFFSAALAVARAIAPPAGAAGPSVGMVVWEITGAILVGAALGALIALYLRYVGRELLFFAILVAFFGQAIARLAHVELLLTMLVAGFVMENRSREGEGVALLHAMERSAAPVFVVFFALSGAKIPLATVGALLPLVLPLALVRAGAIWAGIQLGGRWAGASPEERRFAWMGLISQAGVAIGLASIVAEAYPERGAQLGGMLLALIAINETVGPILFRRGLAASGEVAATAANATPAPVGPVAAPAAAQSPRSSSSGGGPSER